MMQEGRPSHQHSCQFSAEAPFMTVLTAPQSRPAEEALGCQTVITGLGHKLQRFWKGEGGEKVQQNLQLKAAVSMLSFHCKNQFS